MVGHDNLDFVLDVRADRDEDTLDWFKNELRLLEMCPIVNLVICVTRDPSPSPTLVQDSACSDLEKGVSSWFESIEIRERRPYIADLIDTAVASANLANRIIVGACGPGEMIDQTRKAISENMRERSPYISLYTEVSYLILIQAPFN